MRKIHILLLMGFMCFSVSACGGKNKTEEASTVEAETEEVSFIEDIPELEPNLQRLQGNWAASENYEEDEPSFKCAMPATWDKNMMGYYVVSITNNQMIYRQFHKSGNNGSRGGHYDGHVFEDVYEIEEVIEKESDEYQTVLLLKTVIEEQPKEFEFIIYDNPEIYKNSFMANGFANFMFVKLNGEQFSSLMNIVAKIEHEDAMSAELEPYIGMPKEQLENSTWGKPNDINITEIEGGHVYEQWCYTGGRYVYVDDGYVSAIQK